MKFNQQRLGINKDNPDDLDDEQVKKFVRLNIDKSTITWQRGELYCFHHTSSFYILELTFFSDAFRIAL